jgi:hypothetical protein
MIEEASEGLKTYEHAGWRGPAKDGSGYIDFVMVYTFATNTMSPEPPEAFFATAAEYQEQVRAYFRMLNTPFVVKGETT